MAARASAATSATQRDRQVVLGTWRWVAARQMVVIIPSSMIKSDPVILAARVAGKIDSEVGDFVGARKSAGDGL
ncbi:hypothetical protein ACFXPS_34120 [Nocardia sp. NPDC059091]|uniref:hypothetical protein n=1 Tax=Nocardia sp. NPDC059091 TaxID=3346724 RepID=UPI00368700C1